MSFQGVKVFVGGRALPAPSAACTAELLRAVGYQLQAKPPAKVNRLWGSNSAQVTPAPCGFKCKCIPQPWERPKVPWEEEKAFLGEGNGTDLFYSSRNIIPKELSYFIS